MSLQTFIHVTLFTSYLLAGFAAAADWNVDFSRRSDQWNKNSSWGTPTSTAHKTSQKNVFQKVFDDSVPTQEIVILNTDSGFVPASVSVKEGQQYQVHVVNVNEKAKNVSFVLDAFSEHHATYYGKIKSFYIFPKRSGVYSFQSPETSAQGRIVVYPKANKSQGPEVRLPASED